MSQVIVARGRGVVTFDMKRNAPDDATLLQFLLGPSGKLRAPALRRGDALLVGFNEAAYRAVLRGAGTGLARR